MTNVSREENGLAIQETSTADQGQKKYKLNDLEALGNKASPRERCPRGQRRRCLAQAVQAWMDSNEKTARTQEGKRAHPTAGEKSTTKSSAETVTVPQVQFLIRMVNVPVRNNNKDK